MIIKCETLEQVKKIVKIEGWQGWKSESMIEDILAYIDYFGDCCIDIENEQFSPCSYYKEEYPNRIIIDFEKSKYNQY